MKATLATADGTEFVFDAVDVSEIPNTPGIIYFANSARPAEPIYISESDNLARWMAGTRYFRQAGERYLADRCFVHVGPDMEAVRRDAKRKLVQRFYPIMNPQEDTVGRTPVAAGASQSPARLPNAARGEQISSTPKSHR